MAHRSLEETIETIAPSRQRGIPNPPTLSVGVSSDNGDLTSALSQAGQQIQQLQSAYQQQANLITENTQALQSNTSSHSGSAGSTLGSIASNLFGGALGFLSPIISGIAGLFGGSSTPAALPIYTPPPPVSINGVLQSAPAGSSETAAPVSAATSPASSLSTAGQQVAQLQSNYRPTSVPAVADTLSSSPLASTGEAAPRAESSSDVDTGDGAAASSDGALGYLSQIASAITNVVGASSSTQATLSQISSTMTNVLGETTSTQETSSQLTSAITNVLGANSPTTSTVSQMTSAITNLQGERNPAQPQLPVYTPPAAVPVSGVPQPQSPATPAQSAATPSGQPGGGGSSSNSAPQITVNVSAMDSQSFMDRSDDIASAVRAAMLNMHPINDVVADL